jgi:predicted Zn-ribbon and HTH transcriptional regulator
MIVSANKYHNEAIVKLLKESDKELTVPEICSILSISTKEYPWGTDMAFYTHYQSDGRFLVKLF